MVLLDGLASFDLGLDLTVAGALLELGLAHGLGVASTVLAV